MQKITPFPDTTQQTDVWPVSLNLTAALALPIFWWMGFLAGWLVATDGVR